MARKELQIVQSGERTNAAGKPVSNKILLSISDSEYNSLRLHLEYVRLPNHLVLHKSGGKSQDRSVVDAVAFVLANQNGRGTSISVAGTNQKESLNLSFVSDAWWPLVTGLKTRTAVSQIDRRLLELCVVIQVANDLKSGDLCIPESDKFRDYRLQLLSWEEVERELTHYGVRDS